MTKIKGRREIDLRPRLKGEHPFYLEPSKNYEGEDVVIDYVGKDGHFLQIV